MPPLNCGRHEKFAQLVVAGNSRVAAYYKSGYPEKKTATLAAHCAYMVSQRGDVKARIEELMKEAAERNEITVDRTLEEIRRIAFFDVRKLFDEDGKIKPIHELDEETAAALAGIKITDMNTGKGVMRRVATLDKLAALEKCCRYLGIAKENQGNLDLNINLITRRIVKK